MSELRRVDLGSGATARVPDGWVVVSGEPVVMVPGRWGGPVPPAVVVRRADDELVGEALGATLLDGVARLEDSLVVDLRFDHQVGDGEIVVAHRSQGVAVTSHERHRSGRDGRWTVTFTATDRDWTALAGLAALVVASLDVPA